jgi:hypothetical protein
MSTIDSTRPEQQPTPQSGRDGKGRFARGNKGGPGNPFNRRVAALRQLLLERVSDEDLGAIIDRLVEKAKEGDVSAARLVLSYTVGKPSSAVDPDELDIHEMDIFTRETLTAPQSTAPLEGIPASLAATIIRGALPHMTEQRGQTLAAGLTAFDQDDEEEEDDQETPVAAPTPVAGNRADETVGSDKPARRESKGGKVEQEQAKEPEEFASVEQILSWVRGGKMAGRVDGPKAAEASGQAGADSKREKTGRRAANSDE